MCISTHKRSTQTVLAVDASTVYCICIKIWMFVILTGKNNLLLSQYINIYSIYIYNTGEQNLSNGHNLFTLFQDGCNRLCPAVGPREEQDAAEWSGNNSAGIQNEFPRFILHPEE